MEPLGWEEGEIQPHVRRQQEERGVVDDNSRRDSGRGGGLARRLTSMERIKAFTKLGSHNYEQLRGPLTSDTTHAGIYLSHENSSGPNSPHHRAAGEAVLRVDDPSACTTAAVAAAACHETVANGPDPRTTTSGGRGRECKGTSSRAKSPSATLTGRDSFDDEPQFEFPRLESVSSGFSGPPSRGGAGSATAGFPSKFGSAPTSCQKRGGDGGEGGDEENGRRGGIQSEGSNTFGNDLAAAGSAGSFSGDGDNNVNSLTAKARPCTFEFRPIPDVDPPTKLIGAFLQRQSESGSNFLDLDLEMEELIPNPKSNTTNGIGRLSPSIELERQSPSPRRSPVESLYADRSSNPGSFQSSGSPNNENFRGWSQSQSYSSSEEKQDIALNVLPDERNSRNLEQAAAVIASSTAAEDGSGRFDVRPPRVGEVISRKSGSSRQSPRTTPNSVEDQAVKAPAQFVVRPSFSRLKSRLADLPKPPEITKASGPMEGNKGATTKSGQVKSSQPLRSGFFGKLKTVQEEEEEDPFKCSDLPENYRKRDKGVWIVLQWIAFVCILGGLIAIVTIAPLRRTKRGGLMIWKWGLLVLVVLSGRLISGWVIWVLVFIIEKNFLLRKKVVYFVYALRKGVQNCLWLGFALLAWQLMIDPKVNNRVVTYVTKVLVCFLVAALIMLLKTLIVKVFASSFHLSNYFERIQEALFDQYVMETLSSPPDPLIQFERHLDDEKRLYAEVAGLKKAGACGPSLRNIPDLPPPNEGKAAGVSRRSMNSSGSSGKSGAQSGMIGVNPKAGDPKKKSGKLAELDEGISVSHLEKLDRANISAWHMKKLIHIIRNSTLTHSLEETVNSVGMETEIQSEWQAKSAAKRIFQNVAKRGHKVIEEDDLLRFMRKEEATRALLLYDGAAETKCITKQALKNWVVNAYRERRSLALSLNDTKTAVNKLHRVVNVAVGLGIIVVWLLLLGIATSKLLFVTVSQILLLGIVWGNSLKTMFEAIIFLFVMHPFDVGDRCVVDGVQLVVEEMNILTTVFLGDADVKIWYPNSVLATKPIQNFYRSPDMGDGVEFIVKAYTPVEKIAAFKEKIERYIASKSSHWHKDFSVNVLQMSEGERMKLSLGLKHTMNYQNMGEIVKRRSELLLEVKFCLQELDIDYHIPAQEVHIRQL